MFTLKPLNFRSLLGKRGVRRQPRQRGHSPKLRGDVRCWPKKKAWVCSWRLGEPWTSTGEGVATSSCTILFTGDVCEEERFDYFTCTMMKGVWLIPVSMDGKGKQSETCVYTPEETVVFHSSQIESPRWIWHEGLMSSWRGTREAAAVWLSVARGMRSACTISGWGLRDAAAGK